MINESMMQTAKEMVEISSINTTEGEKTIGEYIEKYIREIGYFKAHPNQVIVRELKDDSLHRRNVLAVLIGEKHNTGKTLLLHGHTDTVGLEGYGRLKDYACKPDELIKKLREVELPDDVRKDLDSGDYMFGRGACDMKSGDAVFLGILKEMAKHPEKMSGNIIVSFNPVEENLHTGILEATDILIELKNKYKLDYVMAINNDYICPLYPGDTVKTIYTGVVGKLLPCFYIQGKETHVGQCFEGLDASMMAAELLRNIQLNHELCDEYEGEYSYPPSVLKIKDLKPWYNVQTAKDALVYFNYFVHNSSIEEITKKLKCVAEKTFDTVVKRLYDEAKWFGKASRQKICKYEYCKKVYTYDELYNLAEKSNDFDKTKLTEIIRTEIDKKTDSREVPVAAVRYLLEMSNITSPAIVLYYAAPYCPHNTLQAKDAVLIHDIEQITQEMTSETGEEYRMMRFFPSLSDSSYLRIDDDDESIKMLVDNFPGMDMLYNLPIDNIKALDIPSVNYGCYGKDAHKWTERVNIPYTFGILPKLIQKTIDKYLVN